MASKKKPLQTLDPLPPAFNVMNVDKSDTSMIGDGIINVHDFVNQTIQGRDSILSRKRDIDPYKDITKDSQYNKTNSRMHQTEGAGFGVRQNLLYDKESQQKSSNVDEYSQMHTITVKGSDDYSHSPITRRE